MTKVEITSEEDIDLLKAKVRCTGAGDPYRESGDYLQGEGYQVKVSLKGKEGVYETVVPSHGLVTETIRNRARAILPQIKEEFRREIRNKGKMVVNLNQLAEFLGAKGEPSKYSPVVKNRVEKRILLGLAAINKKLREMPNLWDTRISSSNFRRKEKKLPDDLAIPPLPRFPLGVEDKELGFFALEPGVGFLGFSYLMVEVQRESLNQAQEDLHRILKKYF